MNIRKYILLVLVSNLLQVSGEQLMAAGSISGFYSLPIAALLDGNGMRKAVGIGVAIIVGICICPKSIVSMADTFSKIGEGKNYGDALLEFAKVVLVLSCAVIVGYIASTLGINSTVSMESF